MTCTETRTNQAREHYIEQNTDKVEVVLEGTLLLPYYRPR